MTLNTSNTMKKLLALLLLGSFCISAQNSIDQDIIDIEDKLIEWRHDFHQNPTADNYLKAVPTTTAGYSLILSCVLRYCVTRIYYGLSCMFSLQLTVYGLSFIYYFSCTVI